MGTAPLSSAAFFTPSLFQFKQLTENYATTVGRLASGNRILKTSEDVGGFSIATQLQSQITGLKQASQNAAQGNSLLQVAEDGLTQIQTLLESLGTIAVQANNASLIVSQRNFLQQQFSQNLGEIDRIATNTDFNNLTLLDGTLGDDGVDFHVGTDPNDVVNVTIDDVHTDELFVSTPDVLTQENAADAEDAISDASDTVQTLISQVSGLQQRFLAADSSIARSIQGITEAKSAIADTDVVEESTALAYQKLKISAAVAAIAQAHSLQSGLLDVLKFGSGK